ncbi:hydrophobic protein [Streptomyces sp. NRRL F-4489]|uniref:hydrophobic protein n=1 Tax=Streptomyces sp. NRRL F-4489 TaxID=1609095 RepID=UPI0007472FEF|nr:hydrophobic protein [Streptomyces sp. NRRL F-4489]KUL51444.1 hydrophobic protein [Streptomyces sp. NRRL F-4489]
MALLLLVLLLVLLLAGAGFVLKVLWLVAMAVLAVLVIGFLFRTAGRRGARARRRPW